MRLQKAPVGILGALNLKTEGQNPSEFSDTVLGVIDVTNFYLGLETKISRQTLTIANPGTFGSAAHTVPVGKVWRVFGGGFAGVLNAADAALTTIVDTRFSSDPVNSVVALMPPTGVMQRGGAANRACKLAATFGQTLFLPSGWSVLMTVQLDAAPAVDFVVDTALVLQEFDA